MKIEEYNSKAREAFGKTLVELGVAVFKGIILLITIIPLGFIAKTIAEENENPISFIEFISSMSNETYLTFIILLSISFILGHALRKEGLRHIHESEYIEK
ncbi:hypothetical protein [Vreelandella zhanjiangensis]|uniref:hypothetical protein n=1 Tax=Vreelandella zhanjiangensis TaxID=1121960 RepID=UPI0012DCE511|nr:hypothetical protein [Halomonas zhanjiangensis]